MWTNARTFGRKIAVSLIILTGWFSMSLAKLQAQYSGDNVVFSSSQFGEIYSHAFIDASQLTGSNICLKINSALVQLANHPSAYGASAVIDARGIDQSDLLIQSSRAGGSS